MKGTLEELRRAEAVLQGAHDLIERDGFDIETYEGHGGFCYIGATRRAAGVAAAPYGAACDDNGVELEIALKALDRVARRKLSRDRKDAVQTEAADEAELVVEESAKRLEIGRYVESYGFSGSGEPNETQTKTALKVFRRAITRVHREITDLERAA